MAAAATTHGDIRKGLGQIFAQAVAGGLSKDQRDDGHLATRCAAQITSNAKAEAEIAVMKAKHGNEFANFGSLSIA